MRLPLPKFETMDKVTLKPVGFYDGTTSPVLKEASAEEVYTRGGGYARKPEGR